MKTSDFRSLKKKEISELEKLVETKRTEVMNFRFSLATGALEDSNRLKQAKREVAQLLTLIGEKRRDAQKVEVTA